MIILHKRKLCDMIILQLEKLAEENSTSQIQINKKRITHQKSIFAIAKYWAKNCL